jgi:septum formation protein
VAHPFVAAVELRIGALGRECRAAVVHPTRIAQACSVRSTSPTDTGGLADPCLADLYAAGMATRTLVLASGSTARLRLLREAGFDPVVDISGVSENGVEAEDTPSLVRALAVRKAEAVLPRAGDAVVVACDSLFEFEGRVHGKPVSLDEARGWLRRMRGRQGTLFTGHCVIDGSSGRQALGVAATQVCFANTTDEEIEAYLSTGEAMAAAGAFTLDGRSAPFVDGVEGDPSNVIGLSLPLLRQLLGELGIAVTDLWREPNP